MSAPHALHAHVPLVEEDEAWAFHLIAEGSPAPLVYKRSSLPP
jgi:hypothetical protein